MIPLRHDYHTTGTDGSRRYFERAQQRLVEGVSSPSRGPTNYGAYPLYLAHGQGGHVWDIDGNEYVDLMMSYGAVLLGHAHPAIARALHEAANEGTLFAAGETDEVEVAEEIARRVPSAQYVRFANTGTEATMAVLRLARGITGKRGFVKFEGHYHGWYDGFLVSAHPHPYDDLGLAADPVPIPESSGLLPESLAYTYLTPWNDLDRLDAVLRRRHNDVACVITEPVMANMGVIPPDPGYLLAVQGLCRQYDVLFVLDETVTGFRLAPGGAAERFGLSPDLVTYGKGLGAGLPVAALAGRKDLMDGLTWGGVLHYGTQNASHIGMKVARANLAELGPDSYVHLEALADRLAAGLTAIIERHGVRARVQHVGGMLQIFFGTTEPVVDYRTFCRYVDRDAFRRFAHAMMSQGVYLSPSASLHSVLCMTHTTGDVDAVLEAADRVIADAARP